MDVIILEKLEGITYDNSSLKASDVALSYAVATYVKPDVREGLIEGYFFGLEMAGLLTKEEAGIAADWYKTFVK